MSPLIALLLQLLFSFIESLIEKWLASKSTLPSADIISVEKNAFLSKISWRLWLGPKRMINASKAYDLAVANYTKVLASSAESPLGDLKAASVAHLVVTPIANQL